MSRNFMSYVFVGLLTNWSESSIKKFEFDSFIMYTVLARLKLEYILKIMFESEFE